MGQYTTHADLNDFDGTATNVDALRSRLAGFRRAASASNSSLQADIHLADPKSRESKEFIRKMVVGAALVVVTAAATVTYMSGGEAPQSVRADSQSLEASAPELQPPSYELTPGIGDSGIGLRPPNVRFIQITYAGKAAKMPDSESRIELAKYAAEKANLKEVGLDWRDVYGLIHAETSWAERTGIGKNGVKSHGLSQFEPGTAKSMGIKDVKNPVEAIQGTANLMKLGALWAKERINNSNLSPDQASQAVRTGVSVYYNLSWKARHKWNPSESVDSLPKATQHHIKNTNQGRLIAEEVHVKTLGVAWVDPMVRVVAPQVHKQAEAQKSRMQSLFGILGIGKNDSSEYLKQKPVKPG